MRCMPITRIRLSVALIVCFAGLANLATAPARAIHVANDGGLAPALFRPEDRPRPLQIVFAVDQQATEGEAQDVVEDEHLGETQVAAALGALGEVTTVRLANLTPEHVIAADVLVISAATKSTDLAPYLLKANVPIVAMKPANWNALGLTPPLDDGLTPLQRVSRLSIESDHVIAHKAGPAFELFADGASWPVGQAWTLVDAPEGERAPTVVATGPGGAALIAYDAGDELGWTYRDPSDRAPACRVAFPAHGSSDALLSNEGLDLLIESVRWAGGPDCAVERVTPATPSLDQGMCRVEPADEEHRAANGEIVERADHEEPNLSALWVRALVYGEVDERPVMFVGGRFRTAFDANDASRDDEGFLVDGIARMGVFGCDLSTGTVTELDIPIQIDSMTAKGNSVNNERVRALAFDGTWLYIGGKFKIDDSVFEAADLDEFALPDTVSLLRVDPSTGAIDLAWRPDVRGSVSALAIADDYLYAGGGLRLADGEPVTRLIRIGIGAESSGLADPEFTPLIEASVPVGNAEPYASVLALEIIDGALYFGGSFQSVNGEPRNSVASLWLETGEVTEFAPSLGDNNFGVDPIAQVKDIASDHAGHVFVCGDWWLISQIPGRTWEAYDVDNDAADPNGQGWFGQRSRIQPRPNQFNAGKFDAETGASVVDEGGVPWGPVTDGGVQACAYDESTDTLLLGGHYERIGAYDQEFIDAGGPVDDDDYPNGHQAYEKVTAVDGTTGAVIDWDPDLDSIRGLDAVAIIPSADGGTEIIVGGAITESNRVDRESLARYVWRR